MMKGYLFLLLCLCGIGTTLQSEPDFGSFDPEKFAAEHPKLAPIIKYAHHAWKSLGHGGHVKGQLVTFNVLPLKDEDKSLVGKKTVGIYRIVLSIEEPIFQDEEWVMENKLFQVLLHHDKLLYQRPNVGIIEAMEIDRQGNVLRTIEFPLPNQPNWFELWGEKLFLTVCGGLIVSGIMRFLRVGYGKVSSLFRKKGDNEVDSSSGEKEQDEVVKKSEKGKKGGKKKNH